jgi:negative regulator of flagellin synthesis FlgM
MAVNLNGLNLGSTPASSASRSSAAQSTPTNLQDAAQQPETAVSITSTASLLARLQQALSAQPAVDQVRVDAISKALADGSYRVQGDKIAQGLIHTERALGQLKLSEI